MRRSAPAQSPVTGGEGRPDRSSLTGGMHGGGITRCDDVARGLAQAVKETGVKVPIVIRLIGTNEKEGQAILKQTPGLTPAENPPLALGKAPFQRVHPSTRMLSHALY